MLLPYASFSAEDTVLTLALAVPGVAAVVADRLLRRVPGPPPAVGRLPGDGSPGDGSPGDGPRGGGPPRAAPPAAGAARR